LEDAFRDHTLALKFPLIIPKQHHIALQLVRHYHQEVKHQGRHFTEGAIRAAGYWILDGKRLISSMIRKCTTCLKLRGSKRLRKYPIFLQIASIHLHLSRWTLLFTCLVIRALHIEVNEDISSSSFICALRRFIALRGPVKEIRSDRGTNFVGSTPMIFK